MDVTKILVLLTLVIYLMGLLRALLKPEKVREFIRNRGNLQSRFMAVGLGAVTPFCSCSSIPLFIGFVEAGIPLGVTLSFLIASPMINEVAVVVLASVIGWKFTVLYVADRAYRGADRRLRAGALQAGALGRGLRVENPHGRGGADGRGQFPARPP